MLTGNYQLLYNQLSKFIDESRMFHDSLYTLAYGTDASFYRMIPKLVIKAKNEKEVSLILKESNELNLPVTFRAAGTSLSGQSITDSILLIAGEHWKEHEILEDGKKIRCQPGLIGSKVNILLKHLNKKIGPDPASIASAMIGGIAANNASGMCCGIDDNSYKTVDGMRIIFHDGTVLDTKSKRSKSEFILTHPEIVLEIENLSKQVAENNELVERIKKKYSIKNTTGYSLNALIDFTDPFDIIEHLMIGSEGTLGFISEITYKTIDELPLKAACMMIFPNIQCACNAIIKLEKLAVHTAELIDRAGLKTAENRTDAPEWVKNLSENATAILVETRAKDKFLLHSQIEGIIQSVNEIPLEIPINFTEDPSLIVQYWKIRKGLFPSVGAMRKSGTTVVIEDVVFPLHKLAEATLDIQSLFDKYDYDDAVIFGHAKNGNLHIVFSQDFTNHLEIDRYDKFMMEMTEMIVKKHDGSLKGEHGTGRNMAPFVELEWGYEAFELMKKIKAIFDPKNLLNPGVILNNDKKAHIENLKMLPATQLNNVDKCIECGFCESSCISADLTLSPRQRITVLREITSLKKNGAMPHRLASLNNQYDYAVDQTCATDGLCALSCPVEIDTGNVVKELRHSGATGIKKKIALLIADHMGFITAIVRLGLTITRFLHFVLGTRLMKSTSDFARKLTGNSIPQWQLAIPAGAKKMALKGNREKADKRDKVVYFPSCINRSMGKSVDYKPEEVQLTEKVQKLLRKAGFEVLFPERMNQLCCGMAFSSKGFKDAGLKKSKELEEALWKVSKNGTYKILCDMSPCLYTMKENFGKKMKLYEPVEFILKHVIPKLDIVPLNKTISVFSVCSAKKMGLEEALIELAKKCAKNVIIPETNCCGFAGDRGFFIPELNKHGLRCLNDQSSQNIYCGYSTSRTCEIGLTEQSGISYKSIIYLVDEVSTSKKQ